MFQILSPSEAAQWIQDGDFVAINSFLKLANPEALHDAIAERFERTGHPRDLTLFGTSGFGAWDENRYADRYAKAGAVRRVIASHFSSMPAISQLIQRGEIEAYCMPLGVLSHCVRAAASRQPWLMSKVGLNLFVDPLVQGPGVNERSREPWVRRVEIEGEPYLCYQTPPIDVALIKGTAVDPNGNIAFHDEYVTLDALSLCTAAKARGGKVIVQVDRVSHLFDRPRNVIIPGVLVDAVVVCEPPEEEAHPQIMTGGIHVPGSHMDYWMGKISMSGKRHGKEPDVAQQRIGSRAAQELRAGDVVNIGIGIPEMVGKSASERGILRDVVLTVESGGIGGLPAPGLSFGAMIGADFICDMPYQFDFYDGGGLDICFLGALEIDRWGNVNAHALPGRYVGIGGFANITHATRRVVFCATLTTDGLKTAESGGNLEILQEGAVRKFKQKTHAVSFSARNALERNQEVLYVTERCVFRLSPNGLVLTEVAKGIDVRSQVLDLLDFPVEVALER